MKKIFTNNGSKLGMIKTKKVISILRHDYDNGFVSIDLTQDEIYFNIVLNCCPDSYAGIVYSDYCTGKPTINDYDDDFICPVMDDYRKSAHPLSASDNFGANTAPKYQNKKEIKFILNLIRFACYNNMSCFIQGYNEYPEIEQFIFEPVGLISCDEFERIINYLPFELLDKWYSFTSGEVKRVCEINKMTNRKTVYLPISEIKRLKNIVYDFEYIEYKHSAACVEWSVHNPFGQYYTLDGVYSYNVYWDEMLEGDVSENVNLIYLYLDEDQFSYNYISQWAYEQYPDWTGDNDYIMMGNNEFYHQDCLYWDDNFGDYRFESDIDEEEDEEIKNYIHCYKSSNRNLRSPEKFAKGTKFQVGLEVEVEFNYDRDDAAEFLVENYSDNEHNFILEEDGSLTDGFEMVTSPFIFDEELPSWLSKSLEYLEDDTDRQFNNCGGHVHIDRNNFINRKAIQLFTYLFNNFDNTIYLLSGRDKISPYYAQSQKNTFINVLDVHTTDNNWGSRYVYINRENSATIEVRIFKGCTSKEIIIKRLSILKHMIEYCNHFVKNNTDILEKTDVINDISWYDFSGLNNQETKDFNNGYYEN